ncbi:MAG: polysaccharide biosynthesis protein, partial [Candidatus Desulforudis sp.]|nr:polysaccharide biosynthesis protein [Desulforudis sp.]
MNRTLRISLLLICDALLVSLGLFLAFELRFQGEAVRPEYLHMLRYLIPVNIAAMLGSLAIFRLYHRMWAYAGINELLSVVQAVSLGTIAVIAFAYFTFYPLPRSIMLIAWPLIVMLVGGSRLVWRMAVDWRKQSTGSRWRRNVLIVGAGDAGALVARELKHTGGGLVPIGFIDDDPHKQGLRVMGIPVVGTREDIPDVVRGRRVDQIVVAMPSAPSEVTREIIRLCRRTAAELRILPGIARFLDKQVTLADLRPVDAEDLLPRETVQVDLDEVAAYLRDRVVLVTGAGGSIGSELCRQCVRFGPRRLVLLDHAENGVYELWNQLKRVFPEDALDIAVADLRDQAKVEDVWAAYRPQVVFHAAAHKHVPLMEKHPDEAVRTNVFGTRNAAEAADRHGAEVFILISTDKAVNPTSVMGATKRLAELVVRQLNGMSKTRYAAVRFGNVLESNGSVIPLFKEQIARGGPVTVTHADMTRYFMTIPEAVQLVVQAGAMAEGGEVFVLDMGEPVRILDLAHELVRLSGLEPDLDIEIQVIGARPGEKLYEELLTTEEGVTATAHRRIFTARPRLVDANALERELYYLYRRGTHCTREEVFQALERVLPALKKGPDRVVVRSS